MHLPMPIADTRRQIYAGKGTGLLDRAALDTALSLSGAVANGEDRFKLVAGEISQLVSDSKKISN